ncbi:MAG: hypothetical protein R6U57_08120 [Anaerolineales bacterium]
MSDKKRRRKVLLVVGLSVCAVLLVGGGFLVGWEKGVPVHLFSQYSVGMLWGETVIMNECAECHEEETYHRCYTCHDEHGAVEFADVPFYAMIAFTGDVPDPGYLEVNDVLPYQDHPYTQLPLQDLLEREGVENFESVALISRDGGLVIIPKESLNQRALLMPYSDGIRFASEDLHVSTWLKGLTGIIVVGTERPLTIQGENTSIGRLLLGPTREVTVEQAKVMFASEEDGKVREAQTASRVLGAALSDLLSSEEYRVVIVTDQAGERYELPAEEIADVVLAPMSSGTTLVFPGRARAQWIDEVVKIETE